MCVLCVSCVVCRVCCVGACHASRTHTTIATDTHECWRHDNSFFLTQKAAGYVHKCFQLPNRWRAHGGTEADGVWWARKSRLSPRSSRSSSRRALCSELARWFVGHGLRRALELGDLLPGAGELICSGHVVDHRNLDVRAWPFCVRGDAAPSRQQSRDGDQEAHHLCERSWDFLRSEA